MILGLIVVSFFGLEVWTRLRYTSEEDRCIQIWHLQHAPYRKLAKGLPNYQDHYDSLFKVTQKGFKYYDYYDFAVAPIKTKTINFENRYRTKSGEYLWLNWTAITVRANLMQGIARDETVAKKLKDKLLNTNTELEQFAYIASHDLKAPLRAIINLAEWIEEALKDNKEVTEETRRHLRLMSERVIRMNSLIEGILQYSRVGRVYVDEEVVDTNKIVEEVIDSLEKKQFTINVAKLPNIRANKITIVQLFTNIIGNSIKHHTYDNGRVDVTVIDKGNEYQFGIKDDGPGIDPALHYKLFQMFQTLGKATSQSTGIGLALCRKIVEQAGGKIWVVSEVGKGATFFFTWPKIVRNN